MLYEFLVTFIFYVHCMITRSTFYYHFVLVCYLALSSVLIKQYLTCSDRRNTLCYFFPLYIHYFETLFSFSAYIVHCSKARLLMYIRTNTTDAGFFCSIETDTIWMIHTTISNTIIRIKHIKLTGAALT